MKIAKLAEKRVFKRGTKITDMKHFKKIVENSIVVFAKSQTIYEDGTQSATVEIHFKPFETI